MHKYTYILLAISANFQGPNILADGQMGSYLIVIHIHVDRAIFDGPLEFVKMRFCCTLTYDQQTSSQAHAHSTGALATQNSCPLQTRTNC